MRAYANVLQQVSQEPAFHVRHRPRPQAKPSGLVSDILLWLLWPLRKLRNWWWGFCIRSVVKLFVETHINAKTTEIGRFLREKRLQVAGEAGEDVESLDELLRLVVYAETMVTGWSRFFAPLRFLPGLVMVASWSIAATSYRDLTTQLVLALTLVPLLMLIIYPVVVRFGFRWKRAIFAAWPSDPSLVVDILPEDKGGKPNIYELENRLYGDLGLKKHSEIPVDVILHPAPYWLLTVLVGIIMPLASTQLRGDVRPAGLVIITAFEIALILVFLVPIWRAVGRYRKRKAAGLA